MSKENLSENEKIVVSLQKIREGANETESSRRFAAGLLDYYMTFKDFTPKQKITACKMINRNRKSKCTKKKPKKIYYLYAMVCGLNAKLGYTSDIKKRKSQLQTGSAETINCVWSYTCGKSQQEAKSFERKLHRYCKKYKVRGEWFSNECLPLVRDFKPKVNK